MNPFNYPLNAGFNLEERWMQSRTVFLRQTISNEAAYGAIARLVYLDREDPDAAIQLWTQTQGGSVTAGLAIYDAMQSLKSPIYTVCTGMADGIGSLLLASGSLGQRSAQPHARIRLAQPETKFAEGTASDLEAAAREVFRQRQVLQELYAEITRQARDRIADDMTKRAFMSATEAQDYGLIDRVL